MGSKRARSDASETRGRRFYDGCANAQSLEQLSTKERVAVAASLGYHATIISKYYTIEQLTKKDRCDIPDVTSCIAGTPKPAQYSRITIEIGANLEHVHATLTDLKPTLDTYDVIAVMPTTDKAFQYACSTMDVDIISFSREAMQSRFKFQLKHSLMGTARARGVMIEIPYSAMLTDNTSKRQQCISNAFALVQGAGSGKGIVLSSQGTTAFQLRGPHDVANMATFFGMSEKEALDAVSTRVEGVVARRRKAKMVKGGMEVVRRQKTEIVV